jgi:triphosphatase
MDTGPLETELRFTLSRAAAEALSQRLAAAPTGSGPIAERHEVTTYFDTDDFALDHAGLSLRVRCLDGRRLDGRRLDGRYVQTMKRTGIGTAAPHSRSEWEWPLTGSAPDLGLAEHDGVPLPPGISASALHPIFITDIRRRVMTLRADDQTDIEAALGVGAIRAGRRVETVDELELELKQGSAGALYRTALDLLAATPMAVEPDSKAARGYRLATAAPPAASKAVRAAIDRGMPGTASLRVLVNTCAGHLLANVPAARAGDAEGVHQMRIAVRRLRALLRLFRPLLKRRRTEPLDADLRQLGRCLGEARDWDVFLDQTLAKADTDWAMALRTPGEGRRKAAHEAVREMLAAPRFTRLVLALGAWTENIPIKRRMAKPTGFLAADLLGGLDRTVRKRGRGLRHADPPHRHALRKSLKKFRYGTEFLAEALCRDPAKLIRKTKRVLDSLGNMNDGTVAVTLAASCGMDGARDRLSQWAERQADRQGRELSRRWRRFKHADWLEKYSGQRDG